MSERFELGAEAKQMTMQVAQQTEALILEELSRFLDQGSTVLIKGPLTFTRSPDGKLHFNQMVGLKLRDQDTIEALRAERDAALAELAATKAKLVAAEEMIAELEEAEGRIE